MINQYRQKIIKNSVIEELEKNLYKLDEKINFEQIKLLNQYEESIMNILDTIQEAQEQELLNHMSAIVITLSRTSIMNRKYLYYVIAYNKDSNLKDPFLLPSIDCTPFYQYLDEITQSSLIVCKRYVNQRICLAEIEQEIFQYLDCFNMYFVSLIRKVFQTKSVQTKMGSLMTDYPFMVLQNEISKKPYCIYEKT